jgi:uncharacterized membrane protein SpoIIM required for sporulation
MTPLQFEATYGPLWNELENLLDQIEGITKIDTRSGTRHKPNAKGVRGARLAALYRRSCEHLALAQARVYPIHLTQRLEHLTHRAHQHIYQRHDYGLRRLQHWALVDFPQSVRAHRWYVLAAALLFMLPLLIVGWAAYKDSGFILHVMGAEEAQQYDAMYDAANDAIGRKRTADTDWQMFGFYIMHNIGIGFQCFASGILLGLGSIYYLLYNGVAIGATAGYVTARGHIDTFWPFVVTHSSFELTAIVLSGAAGLRIGYALLAPGRMTRGQSLKQAAGETVPMVYGVIAMLMVAATIEAFWSSARWIEPPVKYGVGAACWVFVIAYLGWQGRPVAPETELHKRAPHAD